MFSQHCIYTSNVDLKLESIININIKFDLKKSLSAYGYKIISHTNVVRKYQY